MTLIWLFSFAAKIFGAVLIIASPLIIWYLYRNSRSKVATKFFNKHIKEFISYMETAPKPGWKVIVKTAFVDPYRETFYTGSEIPDIEYVYVKFIFYRNGNLKLRMLNEYITYYMDYADHYYIDYPFEHGRPIDTFVDTTTSEISIKLIFVWNPRGR
jgi:hypothetical protein